MRTPINTTRLVGKTATKTSSFVVTVALLLAPVGTTQTAVCKTYTPTAIRRLTWSASARSRSSELLLSRSFAV